MDPLFRDRVDGTEDGSVLGYPLLAGTLGDVIPWINANQLIVEMDQPVEFSTVDLSDFVLTINPGLGPDFLPVLTQPVIVSATPGPQTFVGGTATNTIVLTLDIPLQAGNVDPNILGIEILNTGGVAFSDNLIEFDALPGDVDGNGFVQPTDAQLIVNAGPFAALLPGQPVGIPSTTSDWTSTVTGSPTLATLRKWSIGSTRHCLPVVPVPMGRLAVRASWPPRH